MPRRLLVLVLVAAWLLPAAGAVWVQLHVALHHEGHEHAGAVDGTAAVVVDHGGHRHVTPEPELPHPARRTQSAADAALAAPAVAAPATVLAASTPQVPAHDLLLRRAPPPPLFTSHCALLL
jgi:hypothetical protein